MHLWLEVWDVDDLETDRILAMLVRSDTRLSDRPLMPPSYSLFFSSMMCCSMLAPAPCIAFLLPIMGPLEELEDMN